MPTVPIQITPLPLITRRLILVLKDVLILKIDALLQGIEINTPIIGHSSPIPIDPTHSKPDLPLTPGNRMYLGQIDLGHVPLAGLARAPLRGHHPLAGSANRPDPLAGIDNNNNNVEMHVTCRVLPTLPPRVIEIDLPLLAGKREIGIDLGNAINTVRILVVALRMVERVTVPTVARTIVDQENVLHFTKVNFLSFAVTSAPLLSTIGRQLTVFWSRKSRPP
jgi:hypothetical protein